MLKKNVRAVDCCGTKPERMSNKRVAVYARLYTTWLNGESLVFGGRLAPPLPTWYRENIIYFVTKEWGVNLSEEIFANLENLPQSEWPARNSLSAHHSPQEDEEKVWAGWNDSW